MKNLSMEKEIEKGYQKVTLGISKVQKKAVENEDM